MLLPTAAVADILTPLTQEFLPLQGVHAATAVRGYTNAHGAAISNFPSQQRQEGFVFKHPLTVNMLGPTCCCKTYFCLCRTVWRWYGILPKELCGSTNVDNRCMMSFRAKFTPRSNIFKEYFWIWIKIFLLILKRGILSYWMIWCYRLLKIPESTNCLRTTVVTGVCP